MTDEQLDRGWTIACGAATDVGRVRTSNEDSFVADDMVFGVADGMGGHQAGEVASAIAAGILRERLSAGAATVEVAEAAVVEANAAIFHAAHRNSEQRGMGTTLTALTILETDGQSARLAMVNVGDSRTYVLRSGRLRRVSVDHSYVQELVSTGHITEAEARMHPRRNIITRALGIEPTVRVDTRVLPLVRGDRYVLCSDGLVDEVDDEEIERLAVEHADPQAAAQAMVEAANEHGGRDNVTVVVVDVLEGDDPVVHATELEHDPVWAEEAPDRLIDAESAHAAPAVDAPRSFAMPVEAPAPTPAVASADPRRGLGVMLFWVALAAIVVATITFFLVVRSNGDSIPTTDSTVPTSTSVTSTTRPSTSTTGASTTGTTVPRTTTSTP
jgi:protein phosphatase